MDSLGKRLKSLREKKGLSQIRAAEIFGVSNVQISRYESDTHNPDPDLLTKFADFYEVTTDYLLGRTDNPKDKIATFQDLFGKNVVREIPDNFYQVGDLRKIPIVAEIPCGTPIFTQDNIIGSQSVDTSFVKLNGGEYVWVKAKGDSMIEAGITDGSLVLIRLQPEVESGEIAAVCVDQENATLKRVMFADGVVILMPANPDMKPQSYLAERIRIVGKVMKILTDPK